jgi:hypothetical protein
MLQKPNIPFSKPPIICNSVMMSRSFLRHPIPIGTAGGGDGRRTARADCTPPGSREVDDAEDGGDDRVADDERLVAARELDAEPAVDDAHEHQRAAVPDVRVADQPALRVLDVVLVVQPPEDRLDAHQAHEDGTELRVRCLELLLVGKGSC